MCFPARQAPSEKGSIPKGKNLLQRVDILQKRDHYFDIVVSPAVGSIPLQHLTLFTDIEKTFLPAFFIVYTYLRRQS